jgi:hypothetical protein
MRAVGIVKDYFKIRAEHKTGYASSFKGWYAFADVKYVNEDSDSTNRSSISRHVASST